MTDTTHRPMTPQDLTRIRFVSDPQISPDGRRVAFVVTMLSEDKDQYLANIWMVDTAGGNHAASPRAQSAIRSRAGRQTAPTWPFSPSAQHIQKRNYTSCPPPGASPPG